MSNYEKYLGIEYKFNGMSPEEGFDCMTLVHQVAKDDGIFIPIVNHLGFNITNHSVLFTNEISSGRWEQVEVQPKCAVVFRIAGKIQHIGYMINEKEFIHIMENSHVSVERLSSPAWNKRIAGFYLYKGE